VSLVNTFTRRVKRLWRELAKFGSIGAIAFTITMTCFNIFHELMHIGPVTANVIANVIATVFAYLGNRFWTFRHRKSTGSSWEIMTFFALNGIGIAIQTIVLAFSTYTLGLDSTLEKNGAVVVGTGIATLFRYWAYKRWVFRPAAVKRPVPVAATPTALPPHPNGVQPNGQPGRVAAHHPERGRASIRS
jgi:putative flippase GtrA